MGGIGSGAAPRKSIRLTCQWEECNQEFEAKRKDAKYCCQSCRDASSFRSKMIESGELIKCRLCNRPISTFDMVGHFRDTHSLRIKERI